MPRDYAARNRRPTRAAGLPGWVWLVAGLSMGLVVAVIIYIGRPTQPMPMAPAAGAAALATPAKPRPKVEIPPREEPRFDFYTLLEKEQVVIPPSAPAASVPAPVPARPAQPATANAPAPVVAPAAPATSGAGQYLVVAGAFREQANAEQHRAHLALSGIESRIEGITGQDGKTWHRVRIGPENSLADAQSVLARLKAGGFDGRVVKTPQ